MKPGNHHKREKVPNHPKIYLWKMRERFSV